MKHIPTTATAIRRIKSAAKKLKTERGIKLAEALDLSAISAGYDSYHHAIHCASTTNRETTSFNLGSLAFIIDNHVSEWAIHDENSYLKEKPNVPSGKFSAGKSAQSLDDATGALDEVLEEVEGVTSDMTEISKSGLKKIITCCQRCTAAEPAFLDGYAHWAGALVALKQYEQSIAVALPVFNAACAIIPTTFEVFVPYSYLSNRPFHRLAKNLLLAYSGAGNINEAKAIAMKMLKWWPNDNLAFRFLLTLK